MFSNVLGTIHNINILSVGLKYRICLSFVSVVLPPDGIPDVKWSKIPAPDAYGGFELLLDEELAAQGDSGAGLISNSSGGSGGGSGGGRKGNARGTSSWKANQI